MNKKEIDNSDYLSDKSSELLQAIYPMVEKSFPTHSNAHQTDIRKYIDVNHEALFAAGPTYRVYFSEDERDKIFAHIGTHKGDVDRIIKADKRIEKSWYELDVNYGGSFNLVCAMIIRYYHMKKMTKQLENTVLYLALSTYSGRHFKSFPYVPNENIMTYTVNNLSNKYKIKQYGTLIAAIKDTAMVCHNSYIEYIERGTDVLINSYLYAMHTRIAGFLNNIAQEYYKNKQEGKYINLEKDDYDPDNYYVTDNDSFVINRISTSVVNNILSKGIDYRIVKLSANMCNISANELQRAMTAIVEYKNKDIAILVNYILELYLTNNDNTAESITSKKFIEYCLELYIKSNTNDTYIIEIRKILDEWLLNSSDLYVKTNRAATKNNLRKACYLYMIFSIQQEANHIL